MAVALNAGANALYYDTQHITPEEIMQASRSNRPKPETLGMANYVRSEGPGGFRKRSMYVTRSAMPARAEYLSAGWPSAQSLVIKNRYDPLHSPTYDFGVSHASDPTGLFDGGVFARLSKRNPYSAAASSGKAKMWYKPTYFGQRPASATQRSHVKAQMFRRQQPLKANTEKTPFYVSVNKRDASNIESSKIYRDNIGLEKLNKWIANGGKKSSDAANFFVTSLLNNGNNYVRPKRLNAADFFVSSLLAGDSLAPTSSVSSPFMDRS